MAGIPETVRALVAEGHLAHLVTVNADGSPQVSVVWMGVDRQELAHVYLGPDVKFPPIDDPPPASSSASPFTASAASAPGRVGAVRPPRLIAGVVAVLCVRRTRRHSLLNSPILRSPAANSGSFDGLHCVLGLGELGVAHRSASKTRFDSVTQPKMPPWAAIMRRPTSWNSAE